MEMLNRFGGIDAVRGTSSDRPASGPSLNSFLQQAADKALGARRQAPATLDVQEQALPSAAPKLAEAPAPNAPMPFQMAQLQKLQWAMAPQVSNTGISMTL